MSSSRRTKALKQIIDHFGGQAKLAEKFNVKQQTVSAWMHLSLPTDRAIELIDISSKAGIEGITLEDLRH